MKPTREQCLKWAVDYSQSAYIMTPTAIEALCQRVWNESRNAALEEAANECVSITWPGRREISIIKNDTADECAEEIRKLKVTP